VNIAETSITTNIIVVTHAETAGVLILTSRAMSEVAHRAKQPVADFFPVWERKFSAKTKSLSNNRHKHKERE
jgi:hypothetical protein